MNTTSDKISGESPSVYRVKPTLTMALIVVVVYSIYLFTMQYLSGVPYTEVASSTENLIRFALIPIGIGAVLLALFAIYSGWWKDLWHDPYKLDKPGWLVIFPILMILGIVFNFASGNFFSNSASFLLVGAAAMACVGFSEEILFRGIVLRGARGSGFSERKVMLIVGITFGVWHFVNIFTGSPAWSASIQVFNAMILGAVLYLVFRKTRWLIVLMILHAFIDFSIFSKGPAVTSWRSNLQLFSFALPFLYLILLAFAWKHINPKKES